MKKHTFIMLCLLNIAFSFGQEKEIEIEEKNIEQEDIAFAIIEKVPVYPGCKGDDNKTLKKCMSDNVVKHVLKNFKLKQITKKHYMPEGKKRIAVQFKINKEGVVTNVVARSEYPFLEKEAIRVISSLPKFKPGTQRGKPVGVIYSLPIIFEIENDRPQETKKEKRARLRRERKLTKHN